MRQQRLSKRACVVLVAVLAGPMWLRAAARAPIADAAERHDANAIHTLLKQGADVSAAQPDGMTALHWAALHGETELASMLLFAGANVRATTRLGAYTALHLASRAGNAALMATLLDAGADAKARTSTGATPLMLAAETGRTDAVKLLLDRGADANAKESTYGQTALMFAAALDRAEVVALLAARGADPNIASTFTDLKALAVPEPPTAGQSTRLPVEAPAEERKPADAKAPKPPDVPGITRPFRYNELIGAQGGLTPLHFAARQGSLQSARALVDAGANVNAASPADRTTPLYAVVNVQWAPKAAYPQPRAHLQQQCSYLDLMRALLQHGADPNARINRKIWYSSYNFDQSNVDEAGATAFWRAAYAADVDAMRLLVSAGADSRLPTIKAPERRDPDSPEGGADISGVPPLPVGGPNMSALLAAAGPGYSKGFAGNSHHVAPGGMLAAVRYLVDECHADVNDADSDGNTAIHNAASRGDNEMILYLVSKGADVRAVNRRGQTTVDVANGPVQRVQPFPDTIALLEKLGAKNNHKCVSC